MAGRLGVRASHTEAGCAHFTLAYTYDHTMRIIHRPRAAARYTLALRQHSDSHFLLSSPLFCLSALVTTLVFTA